MHNSCTKFTIINICTMEAHRGHQNPKAFPIGLHTKVLKLVLEHYSVMHNSYDSHSLCRYGV